MSYQMEQTVQADLFRQENDREILRDFFRHWERMGELKKKHDQLLRTARFVNNFLFEEKG